MKNLCKFVCALGLFISTFSFGQIDPSNSKNDYDYMGVTHNKGLESFISNYKNLKDLENDKHLNSEVLLNANTLYLGKDESLIKFNSDFSKDNNLKKYLTYLTSKNPDYVKALEITNFRASEDFKMIYQKILTEVDAIDFDDIKTLKNYIVKIKELEEEISKSSVSKDEKEFLFTASSISRYSAVYWFKELNAHNQWNQNVENNASNRRSQIIKMDVAGGVGGAVVGAWVGGVVTITAFGIGAIPGWAAGAITGAVGGSVSQAVIELWEWMFGN